MRVYTRISTMLRQIWACYQSNSNNMGMFPSRHSQVEYTWNMSYCATRNTSGKQVECANTFHVFISRVFNVLMTPIIHVNEPRVFHVLMTPIIHVNKPRIFHLLMSPILHFNKPRVFHVLMPPIIHVNKPRVLH